MWCTKVETQLLFQSQGLMYALTSEIKIRWEEDDTVYIHNEN